MTKRNYISSAVLCLAFATIVMGCNWSLKGQCESGKPQACFALGSKLIQDGDLDRGIKWEKKGCDLNGELACTALIDIYSPIDGQRKDPDKFFKYASESCDKGIRNICHTLGLVILLGHLQNKSWSFLSGEHTAAEFFQKACDPNDDSADGKRRCKDAKEHAMD